MLRDIDNYYNNKEEPNKSCLLVLRSTILSQDENITETLKWGMPCFLYKKKMFCFLSTDKQTLEPYILMVEGKHLHHPVLEQGKRTRMKVFKVNPTEDIPIKTITLIINQALALYKDGIIKIG